MSAGSGSSAAVAPDIATVEALLLANGWASKAQLDRIKHLTSDGKHLLRALNEQNILPADAVGQIDLILQQQAQLPSFRLIKKLGAGGMGIVYLAEHLATKQEVALKVISARLVGDSEFLSRFHRETKALVGLRHPNLANIIESGSEGNSHYLAMESVNGPSLASLLKEYRALPEHYVLGIVRQLADCLNYVYATAGLVHRDIKPENVLIQRTAGAQELFPESDQAKLIDFGLVKTANDDEHLTQTGMTIGTPLYMSPEQVRGDKLDCRSDIYGLGATLFHLLTGSAPFRGTSPGAIMSAHLTQPTPDPGSLVPGLSPGVRRLVMTAMAKDVNERYVTWDALIKACDECLEAAREKHGGSIKLLRKPLVIQKKTPIPSADLGAPPTSSSTTVEGPASERIQRKHAEKKKASTGDVNLPEIAPTPSVHRSVQEKPATPRPAPSTERTPQPAPLRTPRPDTPVSTKSSVSASSTSIGLPSSLRPTAEAAPSGATGALVKAHTDKVRQRNKPASSPATPLPGVAPKGSAVFSEEATESRGTGLLPWLILGGAILIPIICYFLLKGS